MAKLDARQAEDAWRLRLLKAEILIWQGLNRDALTLLQSDKTTDPLPNDLAARRMVLLGLADSSLQELDKADEDFRQAEHLNHPELQAVTCRLLLGEGKVAAMRGHFGDGEKMFRRALSIARREGYSLPEASALGNLGMLNMRQGQYGDAVDWFNASLALTKSQKAVAPTIRTIGNLGWAFLEMGDFDRAEDNFERAASMARQNAMISDEQTWLMNMGGVELLKREYPQAQQTYERSLELARTLEDRQEIIYGLCNLSNLAMLQGQPSQAEQLNQQAFTLERAVGHVVGEFYSDLNEAQIASATGHPELAERYLQTVISTSEADATLKGNAFDTLANLEIKRGHQEFANRLFRSGTAILNKAQQELGRTEFQLSYPTNAEDIYDDYVHFLVSNGKTDEALSVVETHRARTLMEGTRPDTGHLRNAAWSKQKRAAAVRDGHVVLSYWLGRGHSYVWVIGPGGVRMAELPDQDQIAAMVQRYQSRLISSFGASSLDNSAGEELYNVLIGPVKQWIPSNGTITIVPDGAICGLNFETLVVPSPKPHYWIEDVSVRVASSIATLGEQQKTTDAGPLQQPDKLLVIGDPRTPESYRALTHAHAEVDAVAKHFSKAQEVLLTGPAATPTAYFGARPEDYAMIHFVAHGTASRVSPLDSAVVLSDDGKSYNLYARQIMSHAIHARLVTISACDSAGDRVYSAEGLVGMSWAFLRAGAHEVVAALWEVNDASTPHFMDMFYGEVAQGRDPALALRDAKLEMLHSGTVYAKPFYWAPFVLYQGQ